MITVTLAQPRPTAACPSCGTPDVSDRVQCALCLTMVDLATTMATIRGDNDDRVYLNGPLCLACVRGGAAPIAIQLRHMADSHRRFAAQYDEWANGPIDLPGMGVA